MRARELRYGDVLRSVIQRERVIMFLGYRGGSGWDADWVVILPLAGATVDRDNGTVSQMHAVSLGHFELLESGPELPGTA